MSVGAKDLGAQMNFCAKSANKAQTRRFSDLQDMWIKLKRCCSPYHVKVQALKVAAWLRALYGASVVHLPQPPHRSHAGFGVSKPGANPLIHIGLVEGPKADPCFLAIMDAIKDMREFGPAEQAWEDCPWPSIRLARVGSSLVALAPAAARTNRR